MAFDNYLTVDTFIQKIFVQFLWSLDLLSNSERTWSFLESHIEAIPEVKFYKWN